MSKKVSVIVCTYRQESTIARTLDSILSQETEYQFEIVLGEDASPDGTRNICEDYALRHPEIINLLPPAPNKGLMRNYRDCVAACTGDYIMACAGDDWWHNKEKLQRQVEFMDASPEYVMCYTGSIRYNVKMGTMTEIPVIRKDEELFPSLLKVDYVCAPTMCLRRSVFNSIDLDDYINKGYPMEDYPMLLEMANLGKFHPMDILSVTYTHNSDSASTFANLEKQVWFEQEVQRVRKDMVEKYARTSEFNEQYLDDIYYRNLYSHGIKFNDRKFSLKSILQVKRKNSRDLLKVLFALTPWTYDIIRKRNKDFATS